MFSNAGVLSQDKVKELEARLLVNNINPLLLHYKKLGLKTTGLGEH